MIESLGIEIAYLDGTTKDRQGAIERFWRLVIASALNAEIDTIALPYAAKVVRELFMNSAQAGSMGGRPQSWPSRQKSSGGAPTAAPRAT